MKVAVLTMFRSLDTTYSIVNSAAWQVKMLLDHDIQVKVLVCEGCKRDDSIFGDSRIEWVEITDHVGDEKIIWRDYTDPLSKVHGTFKQEAETISIELIESLKDTDVCLMHDILFQGWHYVHNIAIRLAQKKLPNVQFVSLIHSFPVSRPKEIDPAMLGRFIGMPNTTFVYPTYSGISALASQYQLQEGKCKVIYNVMDMLEGMDESVIDLQKRTDLLSPEILIIYPCRMTPAKAMEKVAILAGRIKQKKQRTVKVIFCDFPSIDIDPDQYKAKIIDNGTEYGLDTEDIVFTSDQGYKEGFPRKGVLDLFLLSNLYICPSFSESFGLTVVEAASRGNFIVVNNEVPALHELGDKIRAYKMSWSAKKNEDNFFIDYMQKFRKTEIEYYDENAEQIVQLMLQDKALFSKTQIRRFYNAQWIWENQMAPVLGLINKKG